MSSNYNQDQPQVAYPPPQPPAAYSAPPPAGYPTRDSSDNPATTAPVKTQYRGDGFWKGCCAALCCCCVLDACF